MKLVFKKANMQTNKSAAAPHFELADAALWRLPTVLAHYPVSRAHWLAGVRDGRFPAPVRLSARCVAWRASDVLSLISSL